MKTVPMKTTVHHLKRRRQRHGKSAQGQADGKWYLKGFGTSPGGIKPVAGNYKYTVGGVESQLWVHVQGRCKGQQAQRSGWE